MGLRLHGEDVTKATNFQELFKELKELDRANGKEEFFKIEFPAPETPEEERLKIFQEIRDRVIQLFAASAISLINTEDKEPLMRDYVPVPGQATRYFDQEDLNVLAEDIRGLLDPNDAHFQAALADREVGVLQLLGKTLNFAIDHGDPRAAFKLFQRLTRGVRLRASAAGIPVPEDILPAVDRELAELSWKKDENAAGAQTEDGAYRKNILRARSQEMIQLDYRLKNPKLVQEIQDQLPRQRKLWTGLVDSYNAATLDLGVNDFQREEWFHILFSNIVSRAQQRNRRLYEINRSLYDALKKLSRDIRTATKASQISDAINTFVRQTFVPTSSPPSLPSLVSSPAQPPSEPEVPPKSS